MTVETKVQIGNKVIYAEQSATYGKPFQALNNLVCEADTALSVMNVFEKTAILMGKNEVASRLGFYTGGTSVPYLFSAGHSLYHSIRGAKQEGMNGYHALKISHGVFDTSAMAAFSLGVFAKNSQPLIDVGTLLNTASDATDIGLHAKDAAEAREIRSLLANSSIELQSAVRAKEVYSLYKLAKAVAGTIAGFFSSYSICMGAALASSATVAVAGLANAVFDLLAYSQKNYQSKYFAQIEMIS